MLEETKRQESKFIMSAFARYDVEFVRGEGMWLFDDKGEKYLDFLAGIAVCSLGHRNKALASTIAEQASKLMHVSNYFYIENRAEVAQHISDLLNRGTNEASFAYLGRIGSSNPSFPFRGRNQTNQRLY